MIVPRRLDDGGPYHDYACPTCRRKSRVERNRAGAYLATPPPIVPVFDALIGLFDAQARRDLARKREHARRRVGRRAWFFGPYAEELIESGRARALESRWTGRRPRAAGEGRRPRAAGAGRRPHAAGAGPRPEREPRGGPEPRGAPPPPPPEPEPEPPPPPPPEPEPESARTPHEILGVEPGATKDEVTKAFRDLARRYHPDRFAGLDDAFQELAHDRFKRIQTARDALMEEAERRGAGS